MQSTKFALLNPPINFIRPSQGCGHQSIAQRSRLMESLTGHVTAFVIFVSVCCHTHAYEKHNYVYKYFMDTWPSTYDCGEKVPLTEVNYDVRPCIINNKSEEVFIVDPSDFEVTWDPKQSAYSILESVNITFKLLLKGQPHPFVWLRVIPAAAYGPDSPTVSGHIITINKYVGGHFRYYIVTPFKAIGFTLKG
uniref:Fibronectin type-III domain-containing protein n=1 Tax=Mesocestoides corti TaxID=53468 RepID=A0A5K3F5A0_MESCO